jgi:hypothetical protein
MEELRIATERAPAHGGGRRGLTKHSLPRVLILLFVCAAFYPFSFAADSPRRKNVLVLYSFSDPRLANSQDALEVPVRKQVHAPVDFEVEYLEAQRFEDLGYEQSLSNTLRHAYENQAFDVVVVDAYPALRFAIAHRSEIFPGVPIVFSSVYVGRIRDEKLPPGVTGVTETEDVRGSLELAFRLQPDTKHVALVTGTTEFERYWLGEFHKEFLPFKGKVDLIDLVGLPMDQLMRQTVSLPPQTVVFFQIPPQFSTQPVLGTYDALLAIGQRISHILYFRWLLRRPRWYWRILSRRHGANRQDSSLGLASTLGREAREHPRRSRLRSPSRSRLASTSPLEYSGDGAPRRQSCVVPRTQPVAALPQGHHWRYCAVRCASVADLRPVMAASEQAKSPAVACRTAGV